MKILKPRAFLPQVRAISNELVHLNMILIDREPVLHRNGSERLKSIRDHSEYPPQGCAAPF